ncbi:hypothetical protein DU508_17830 [Pedobacter chinensis]|uniref:Uncharacterized protein n=1 Tax=Pedobacter chinensis TaxID=2282421 RepID=A0A369PVJ0_9SPHI|nr:hypothetical protein DU508_17830 [Pedobacter chinensis]
MGRSFQIGDSETDCFVVPPRNDGIIQTDEVSPGRDPTKLRKSVRAIVLKPSSLRTEAGVCEVGRSFQIDDSETDCFVVPPRNDGIMLRLTKFSKPDPTKLRKSVRAIVLKLSSLRTEAGACKVGRSFQIDDSERDCFVVPPRNDGIMLCFGLGRSY